MALHPDLQAFWGGAGCLAILQERVVAPDPGDVRAIFCQNTTPKKIYPIFVPVILQTYPKIQLPSFISRSMSNEKLLSALTSFQPSNQT